MVVESNETANGWPFGLGNINPRIRVVIEAPPLPLPPPPHLRRNSSFSSMSSSNLDTESTASFFPDQSVPLGRLIGMMPAKAKAKAKHCEHEENVAAEGSHHLVPKRIIAPTHNNNSQGICVPLLHHVIARIL